MKSPTMHLFLSLLSLSAVFCDSQHLRKHNSNLVIIGGEEWNDSQLTSELELYDEDSNFFRTLEETMSIPTSEPTEAPKPTIWDIVTSRSAEFSTFIALAVLTELAPRFQDPNREYTLFVPTNDAFAAVQPLDLLSKYLDTEVWGTIHLTLFLQFHWIRDDTILSTDLVSGAVIIPSQGILPADVTVILPPPQLSMVSMPVPGNIIEVDHIASNGVVHVIDQVLTSSFLRVNAVQAAIAVGSFNILVELIEVAGLWDILNGPGPFSVYAPPDEVFEAYGESFIEQLRDDPLSTRVLLLNHIIYDQLVCPCEPGTYTSAAGFELKIEAAELQPRFEESDDYTVNGVATAPGLANLLVSNAKVGVITDILCPPSSS
jgi:uncharacterized surface protein with fasciclin (FAS1) repeats